MRPSPHPATARLATPRRAACAALAGLASAALLSGCVAGSRTTTSTFGAATGPASTQATAKLPTGAASLAGTTQDPNAQPVPTGEGVPGDRFAQTLRDAIAARGSVRMSMTTAVGSASAHVDMRSKAMRVQVDTGKDVVTLVHLGGRTWVRGAGTVDVQVPPKRPGGTPRTDTRHWLLLDPSGADTISRRLGAQAQVEQTLDPARFTRMLDGLLGDKTPRGEGSQVAFTVPPTTYLDAVGAPPAMRSSVSRPVSLVVALDGSGAPTSVTTTVPMGKGEVVDRTEYSRWGAPVDVEAPSPDDVAAAPGSVATPSAEPSATPEPSATVSAPTASGVVTPSRTARASDAGTGGASSAGPSTGR